MGNETEIDPINEMVAEGGGNAQPAPTFDYQKAFEEQKAANAIMQQQINQSLAIQQQLAERAQQAPQQQHSAPIDPYAGFEPETAKAIKGVVGAVEANFKQQLAATQQELAALRANTAINQIAQVGGGKAPQVVLDYASNLYKNLQAKGVPVTAQEVYDMAYGQALREGKIQAGQPQQQQYGQPPTVLNGGSRAPQQRSKPSNFNNLSLQEQARLLDSTPGFHDEEF